MMTGTGEARIFSMIFRMDESRPPGVRRSIRTALALVVFASVRPRSMYSAVMGWMASSTVILRTSAKEGSDARRKKKTRKPKSRALRIRLVPGYRELFVDGALERLSVLVPGIQLQRLFDLFTRGTELIVLQILPGE